MRKLLELDSKNYPETDATIERVAARANLIDKSSLYMIKSDQYGESLIDTLKREVFRRNGHYHI